MDFSRNWLTFNKKTYMFDTLQWHYNNFQWFKYFEFSTIQLIKYRHSFFGTLDLDTIIRFKFNIIKTLINVPEKSMMLCEFHKIKNQSSHNVRISCQYFNGMKSLMNEKHYMISKVAWIENIFREPLSLNHEWKTKVII